MQYLYAILALGLLIAFHELGHLLAARLFGIRVDRFSIGFGPAIVSWRRGGIDYAIGALPLGGYVKIHGMNPFEEGLSPEDRTSFAARPVWQRLLVILAGPLANYLLAVAVLFALYLSGTHVVVPMRVGTVAPASEAARAQLRPGDRIVAVDGEPVSRWSDLAARINDAPGRPLVLRIDREGVESEVRLTPRDENGVGRIGIGQQYVHRRLPFAEALGSAFVHTTVFFEENARALWRVVTARRGGDVSGPVGIVKAASDAASSGADAFLRVIVAISVALAFFNLLPIPALDGGRLLFLGIEAVTRRPVNPKVEATLHGLGFFALIALIVFAIGGDVRKLARRGEPPAQVPAQPLPGGTPTPDAGVAR